MNAEPRIDWLECPACQGYRGDWQFDPVDHQEFWAACNPCRGKGRIPTDPAQYRPCQQCDGTGYLIWGGGHETQMHVDVCRCDGDDEKCALCRGARLIVRDDLGNRIDAVAGECHYC